MKLKLMTARVESGLHVRLRPFQAHSGQDFVVKLYNMPVSD